MPTRCPINDCYMFTFVDTVGLDHICMAARDPKLLVMAPGLSVLINEFTALVQHLPSGAPNRTTDSVQHVAVHTTFFCWICDMQISTTITL